jgi:hypothetical protein
MHVAVVVDSEPPAAILDHAVGVVRSCGGTISVVGVPRPVVVGCAMGWIPPAVLTDVPRPDSSSAANLARRVVDRLPADIPATHSAFLGWQCPRLLGRLRSGDFDLVLFAGWPFSPFARRALLRAARLGCSPVIAP